MDELQKSPRDRLDLGSALQQAARHETGRMLSWVLATAIVAAVFALAARDLLKVMVVVICGVALLLWSIRLRWGIVVAARDFRQVATRPNRAFVVLVHDVNPKAFRPLLGMWALRPIALVRELTKVHEQVLRGTPGEVREALRAEWRRGEMVLVLGGATRASRARAGSRRSVSGDEGSGQEEME